MARLNYTLVLFRKDLNEAAAVASPPEGVVVIFDAADGGMASATMADIRKLASGVVTRQAFVTDVSLDPVEAFRDDAK